MINKVCPVRNALLTAMLGLMVSSCGPSRYEPVRNVYRSPTPVTQGIHLVESGESLYAIAWRYNRNYKDLARMNGIVAPYRIYPGQRLDLSDRAPTKPRERQPAPKPSISKSPTRYKNPENDAKVVQEKVANSTGKKVDISWRWPAKGEVIKHFSLSGQINKGIDLAGKRGEPVFAAANGTVVYRGTGMVGYGNLVIIKHSEDYLSAYAHNSRLLVNEGESTQAGQKIAEIGSTGASRDKLHFEIRRQGKPVNPLQYLPKR